MPSRPVGAPVSAPTMQRQGAERGGGRGGGSVASDRLRQPEQRRRWCRRRVRPGARRLSAGAEEVEVGPVGQFLLRGHHHVVAPQDAADVATAGADGDDEGAPRRGDRPGPENCSRRSGSCGANSWAGCVGGTLPLGGPRRHRPDDRSAPGRMAGVALGPSVPIWCAPRNFHAARCSWHAAARRTRSLFRPGRPRV